MRPTRSAALTLVSILLFTVEARAEDQPAEKPLPEAECKVAEQRAATQKGLDKSLPQLVIEDVRLSAALASVAKASGEGL